MIQNSIYELLDKGRSREALLELESLLALPMPKSGFETLERKCTLGACCVEVGAAVSQTDLVEKGIAFFQEVAGSGHPALDLAALEYNLGNGFKSIHDLGRRSAKTPFSVAVG